MFRHVRLSSHRRTSAAAQAVCRLTSLEERTVLATISIADAAATEGTDVARSVDVPISSLTSPVDAPKSITRGPNGDYFVTSALTRSVLRYDGSTFAYLGAFVPSGSGGLLNPIDLVFAGGRLFVSDADADAVRQYDAATGSYLGDLVPPGAHGIDRPTDMLARGGDLYVGAWSGDVHRYNIATGTFVDKFVQTGAGGLNDPAGIQFGPDGNFYVAEYAPGGNNAVLRYDGTTGAFLGEFVPAQSGGMSRPAGIKFGPDGNLYVADMANRQVLRFQGDSGAFAGVVVAPGQQGISDASRLLFAGNQLLVCSQNNDTIARFEVSPWAVFNVALSSAASVPVTVQFATADGTALAGSDYAAITGTVTFSPGETSKTILVQTVDDALSEGAETFVVNLSNPVGATLADAQGAGTIFDDEPFLPQVGSVTVNGGVGAQRSRVTSVTVTFNEAVTFAGPVADAFALARIGGGAVGSFTAAAAVVNGITVVTLANFAGAEAQFGSLADGRYSVTVRADQVSSGGQPLDGNGDGLGGDDYALNGSVANGLYRLYGDANGDGTVNAADFGPFRGAFGSSVGQSAYLDYLDLNGDGVINAFDFAQFRTRFGSGVP
jgi:glucose/arabinose dehydrogenase